MVDVARRLCEDNHIHVAEIWSYHVVGDEPRFTLVHRSREAPPVARARPAAHPSGTPPKAAVPVRKATHRVAKPPRHVRPRVPKSKTTRPKAAKHTKSAAANKRK
jgi:hypothetical protein